MHRSTFGSNDLWAKLSPRDEPAHWHPLEDHCLDVACVAEALLALPTWRARLANLGLPVEDEAARHAVCVLVGLHDLGKFSPGFQRAWRGSGGVAARDSHTNAGLSLISPQRRAAGPAKDIVARLADMLDDDWLSLLVGSICHHGGPPQDMDGQAAGRWQDATPTHAAALFHLLDTLDRAFPLAAEALLTPLAFPARNRRMAEQLRQSAIHALCGLTTQADWLGSDTRWFPYRASRDEDRVAFARAAATRAVQEIGVEPHDAQRASQQLGFSNLVGPGLEPRPLQALMAQAPLPEAGSITVIEDATGSGKTEAALLWFLRLFQAGRVDGLYFALPRRTAAIELHERVRGAVERLFPNAADRPPVVLAVPGYLQADDHVGQRLPGFEVRWEDDAVAARGWAAEHPKRYLTAPIAVGTVDQVLLATLRTKHTHMRAVALLRQLIVVDEVHASDTYMTSLLRHALQRQVDAGGHALLLSATLGADQRALLRDGTKRRAVPLDDDADLPYPAVWLQGEDTPRVPAAASSQPPKVVSLQADRVPDGTLHMAMAQRAAAAVRAGGRVLVLRNLVADAVLTQQALETLLEPEQLLRVGRLQAVAPHHSRFAPGDRKRLDAALLRALGGKRSPGPIAVVATSTAEQSLDIDADLLITDLCPVDVLLQRIGRLHRHQRVRPAGFEDARCVVVVPETPLEELVSERKGPDPGVRGPHGYGPVHRDVRILANTLALVDDQPVWTLPADNRRLVERALHREALDKHKGGPLGAYGPIIQALNFAEKGASQQVLCKWGEPFESSRIDSRPPTRLGADDVMVDLAEPFTSPFDGSPIAQVRVPGHWRVPADGGGLGLAYDRCGLQHIKSPTQAPHHGALDERSAH